MSDEDLERFGRAAVMLKMLYPEMMRQMIERKMPATKLEDILQNNEQGFNDFLQLQEKKALKSISAHGYKKLDESILCKVITFFELVDKPTNGWTWPPQFSFQVTTGDDVERMRSRRNKMMHLPSPHMTQDEWNEFYDELLGIARRCDQFLGIKRYEREAELMKTQWIDASKRNYYIKSLENVLQLKEQFKSESLLVRYYHGEDIAGLLEETNEANASEDVFLRMYLHGVVDEEKAIKRLERSIEKLRSEIKVTAVSKGSICFLLRTRRRVFISKDTFHTSLSKLIDTVLPFIRFNSLTVTVSIDTSVGYLFKDLVNWRNIREQTLPNLENIENNLSRAANNLRDFRTVRNAGVGVAVMLGLLLVPFTFGGTVVAGGIAAAGMGGVTLLSIIVEFYLTHDVMDAAQSQIKKDSIQTRMLEGRVNYYIQHRVDRIQKLLATRLRENFPNAIYSTENKPFSDFILSFIKTDVGSIFRARDEVTRLLNDLRIELHNVERIEREARLNVYF